MLPYARLRPGPGFEPGHAALYYAQRLITRPGLRGTVASTAAALVRSRQGRGDWDPPGDGFAEAGAALRGQGLAMLPGLVPETLLADIRAGFEAAEVIGPGGRTMPLAALPPGTRSAAYPLRRVLESRALLELVTSAPVLRLAADYLGCKPTLSSLGVRWSLPAAGPSPIDVQHFHRDPDEWRAIKLFVYLTDVPDEGCGPFTYVAGSHRTAGTLRARPYDVATLRDRYGAAAIRSMLGPAGTAFVADSYGIHAGIPPLRSARLILQAQYSVLPIYCFRYDPLPMAPPPGADPYVARLLIAPPRGTA